MKLYINDLEIIGTNEEKKRYAGRVVFTGAEIRGYDPADALAILDRAMAGDDEAREQIDDDFEIEVLA